MESNVNKSFRWSKKIWLLSRTLPINENKFYHSKDSVDSFSHNYAYYRFVHCFFFVNAINFHWLNIIFVSLVIVVLILANFFIPPTIGSKLIVGLFNLAVLCSYLLYFKTVLPAGNVNTPLIGNSFIIQKDAIPLFCDVYFSNFKFMWYLFTSFFLQWVIGRGDFFHSIHHTISTLDTTSIEIGTATDIHSKLFIRSYWDYPRGLAQGY